MRPILITFLLIFFSNLNYSQDSTATFRIGVQSGVYWSDRILKADGEVESLKSQFDSLEQGRIKSSAGVVFAYCHNSQLSITSGLLLRTYGFFIDSLESSSVAKMRYNFQYLEIPLNLEFTFNKFKTWQPLIQAGISYQYLVGMQRRYFEFGQTTEILLKETEQYVTSGIGINLGIGINKKVNDNSNFQIGIAGQRNLTSISKTPIERYWQNAGIYFALTRDIGVRKK